MSVSYAALKDLYDRLAEAQARAEAADAALAAAQRTVAMHPEFDRLPRLPPLENP